MVDEETRRDTHRTANGWLAACAMTFSCGWLFYVLMQPQPIATSFEIGVLATASVVSGIFVCVFSFDIAMTLAGLVGIAEGAVVLMAFTGFVTPLKLFHPYGAALCGIVVFALCVKAIFR